MTDITSASVTELSNLIRSRDLSAVETVTHYLQRIERHNPAINAVVVCDPEQALEAARQADRSLAAGEVVGPLHGVPVTLKDTFEVANMVSTSGTRGRERYLPTEDATVAARLRAAGAIILGKTNTPELAQAHETTNLIHGATSNPYDLRRTAGGSSGGPTAAVAAGFSALDVGSDGGGSIRIPAAFCGVAALKATTGRVPGSGHFPVCSGIGNNLVGYGPIARSVSDLVLALGVLEGEDWRDPLHPAGQPPVPA